MSASGENVPKGDSKSKHEDVEKNETMCKDKREENEEKQGGSEVGAASEMQSGSEVNQPAIGQGPTEETKEETEEGLEGKKVSENVVGILTKETSRETSLEGEMSETCGSVTPIRSGISFGSSPGSWFTRRPKFCRIFRRKSPSESCETRDILEEMLQMCLAWPNPPVPDRDMLEEIVKQFGSAKLLNCQIVPAFHPSTYNRSFIHAIAFKFEYDLDGHKETFFKHVLAKTLPQRLVLKKRMLRDRVFQREVTLYGTTFPDMLRRLRSAKGSCVPPFFPRMFPVSELNTLVLEDLREEYFTVESSCRMLDGDHATKAILALARFHAASVAVHHECPDALERYDEMEFLTSNLSELIIFVEGNILGLADEMTKWKGCEKYRESLKSLGKRIVKWLIEYVKFGKNHFHALIHGDFWTDNILFHHEHEIVDEVRFVDYQNTRWAPAILDILYFVYTSVRGTERGDTLRYLLELYEEELRATLKSLGLEELAPSMEKLMYDLHVSAPYAAYAACLVLPIALCNKMSIPFKVSTRKPSDSDGETESRAESTPIKTREETDNPDIEYPVEPPPFLNPILSARHSVQFQEIFCGVLDDLFQLGAI